MMISILNVRTKKIKYYFQHQNCFFGKINKGTLYIDIFLSIELLFDKMNDANAKYVPQEHFLICFIKRKCINGSFT